MKTTEKKPTILLYILKKIVYLPFGVRLRHGRCVCVCVYVIQGKFEAMRNLKLECENLMKNAHAPKRTPMIDGLHDHVDCDVRLK